MTRVSMGRLAKVDLRKAWASRPGKCSHWLDCEAGLPVPDSFVGEIRDTDAEEKIEATL